MCSPTQYVLIVASALLLPYGNSAPQGPDVFAFINQMKQSIIDCTAQANVSPNDFREVMRAGKAPQEYGCIYKCIMMQTQWMDASGNMDLPEIAPQATAQCVKERTASYSDLCDKAWQAAECWIQTREQLFSGFAPFQG